MGAAPPGVQVSDNHRNAGFSSEGKPSLAVPEEQACLLIARTASGDGANGLTAGMTAFPVFFFISDHPEKNSHLLCTQHTVMLLGRAHNGLGS